MKINDIIEINEYFQHNLFEMSNYYSDDTGLSSGTKLWIRTEPNGLPHTKYRIKIEHPQKGDAVFALWGDETQQVAGNWKVSGKDLKKITFFIQSLNISLRSHIDGEMSSLQLGSDMTKIKSKVKAI